MTDSDSRTLVNIYERTAEGDRAPVSYFSPDEAERWDRWDGRLEADGYDVNTGVHGRSETLLRSTTGRWILEHRSNHRAEDTWHELVDAASAWRWLKLNDHHGAAERYFGDMQPRRGPGRPEIGDRIGVRLPDELRTWVEHRAEQWSVPLAEAIRRIVQADRAAQAQAERQAASAALPEPREFHKGDTIPAEVHAVVDERGYRWERTGETATWWVCEDLCFEPLPVTTEKLLASYGPATEADV